MCHSNRGRSQWIIRKSITSGVRRLFFWLGGVLPGATVQLQINGAPAMTGKSVSDTIKFTLPSGDRIHLGDRFVASQVACGITGTPVGIPGPVAQNFSRLAHRCTHHCAASVSLSKGYQTRGRFSWYHDRHWIQRPRISGLFWVPAWMVPTSALS